MALAEADVDHGLSWVDIPGPGWKVELFGRYARPVLHWSAAWGWSYRVPGAVEEIWIRRGPGEALLPVDELVAQLLRVARDPSTAWSFQVLYPNVQQVIR